MNKFLKFIRSTFFFLPIVLLVLPSSTNYRLDSYGFGPGSGGMNSASYGLEAILGEVSGNQSSTNYKAQSGLVFLQQSNVPSAPTLANSSNWYNKLNVIINTSNNPSDALYAVAISDDDWVTTRWIQSDNTVGATLGAEDYQTYTNWGGVSGENIIGLTPGTTYKVKVKAAQPGFTESPLGPEATAATVNSSLDFDIDVSATDAESVAPYVVAFGSLSVGSVNTAADKIWIDFATNAESGGIVYVYSANGGLRSTAKDYTITSATANLASVEEGFGVKEDSTSNLTFVSPYNGASDNVGVVDATIRELLTSGGSPVASGRASVLLKAKPKTITPASSDYSETITIIASGNF